MVGFSVGMRWCFACRKVTVNSEKSMAVSGISVVTCRMALWLLTQFFFVHFYTPTLRRFEVCCKRFLLRVDIQSHLLETLGSRKKEKKKSDVDISGLFKIPR